MCQALVRNHFGWVEDTLRPLGVIIFERGLGLSRRAPLKPLHLQLTPPGATRTVSCLGESPATRATRGRRPVIAAIQVVVTTPHGRSSTFDRAATNGPRGDFTFSPGPSSFIRYTIGYEFIPSPTKGKANS